MTPHWSGRGTVSDAIDGAGARRLVQTGGGNATDPGPMTMDVTFATQTLATAGTVASTLEASGVGAPKRTFARPRRASPRPTRSASRSVGDRSYDFTKYVGIDTALTSQAPETSALAASQNAATRAGAACSANTSKRGRTCGSSDITVGDQPDLQDWIRANLYDLWSSIRAGTDDSISPVGLSSDNYAGLIFWDAETWMYPSLLLMHPDIAESVIEYRRRRSRAR